MISRFQESLALVLNISRWGVLLRFALTSYVAYILLPSLVGDGFLAARLLSSRYETKRRYLRCQTLLF